METIREIWNSPDKYTLAGLGAGCVVMSLFFAMQWAGLPDSPVLYILVGILAFAAFWMPMFLIRTLELEAQRRRALRQNIVPHYHERIKKLTDQLVGTTADVARVIEEIALVTSDRQEAMKALETKIDELAQRETQAQANLESLQDVSFPAVEHFLEVVERGEKRSALRDYAFFGLGLIVAAIGIILELVLGA